MVCKKWNVKQKMECKKMERNTKNGIKTKNGM